MTRKEAQRRLAAAIRGQRSAQEKVREANARVVEATRKLPPHYVDEHRRFAPGERERIQKLIDHAQRASDRLASMAADVVNLRRLVGSDSPSAGQRDQATKKRKTGKQLDRDIAQSLAASGQPQLADLFSDPDATKEFARQMRHELQKKQLTEKSQAAFAERPFTVKHTEMKTVYDDDGKLVERKVRSLVGNFKTEAEARARADQLNGWVETRDGRVVYGKRPSDHATRRGAKKKTVRAHAKRIAYRLKLTPSEMKAVEFARGRYAWPDMLSAHAAEDGSVAFTESEMWQWVDDVDSDDAPFPLAAPAFAAKLQRFYDEKV